MPTQCFLGEFMDKRPGAMWTLKMHGTDETHWVVRLPNGGFFDINSKSSTDRKPWTVTGEAPNLTCRPSIVHQGSKYVKGWHGWLTNGVLSDDVEGRAYP